jgi:CO dehydrogenase/acetyl-CoA synthase gamma subunit (corrinoid Fe-S protein)
MKYKVDPGLYALGEPDDTPLIVTANYKMSFDA